MCGDSLLAISEVDICKMLRIYVTHLLYLDSDATDHMVNDPFGLVNVKYDKSGIKCADNNALKVEYCGDLNILVKNMENYVNRVVLKNVLYVPNLCCGLIWGNRITEKRW